MTENNQDLTKVYELIQKENRWNRVTNFAQAALMLIPTLVLIWKSFKSQKPSPKQRLMRIEAAIARLQLERKAVRQEAIHETELKKMEMGLEIAEENNSDLFSDFKQKGESLLKDKVDKFTSLLDKEKDKKN